MENHPSNTLLLSKVSSLPSSDEPAAPAAPANKASTLTSTIKGSHSTDDAPCSRAAFARRLVQEHSHHLQAPAAPPARSGRLNMTTMPLGVKQKTDIIELAHMDGLLNMTTTPGGVKKQKTEITKLAHMDEPAPLKIGIIGAGMAGLYAALILDSLELTNYEILEANPDRVGGRVLTQYFKPVSPQDKDIGPSLTQKWSYIDYGAMRFPCIAIMDRVIGRQQWSLTNYLNSHTKGNDLKINLLDYHLSVPNNIQYYNSIRKTNAEMERDPKDPLHFGKSNKGGVDDKYVQDIYKKWLDPAFGPFKELLEKDFMEGFKKLMEYDHFSVRAYLRTCGPDGAKYPQELIDYLETLDSGTGQYDEAFTEAVLDSFDFDSPGEDHLGEASKAVPCDSFGSGLGEGSGSAKPAPWRCVEGGMSRFPYAMQSVITSKPELGKRVSKIAPIGGVGGSSRGIDVFVVGEANPRKYNHVINTVPPAVLRSLDTTECNFSYAKRTALRVLCVGASVKVGLLFKSRWWQDEKVMKGKPMKGGQSSTDLPIRTIVYPSYGIDDANAPGVLIASYSWGQDAVRISALAAIGRSSEVIQLTMSNIALVHGVTREFLEDQYLEQYEIHDWDQDVHSQGAFALFGPGQFNTVYLGLVALEMKGCYHTAGEMASVHHAWIVGALNSAWRCVYEILCAECPSKIDDLQKLWGRVEEVDTTRCPTNIN